jgi:hypothetical protein
MNCKIVAVLLFAVLLAGVGSSQIVKTYVLGKGIAVTEGGDVAAAVRIAVARVSLSVPMEGETIGAEVDIGLMLVDTTSGTSKYFLKEVSASGEYLKANIYDGETSAGELTLTRFEKINNIWTGVGLINGNNYRLYVFEVSPTIATGVTTRAQYFCDKNPDSDACRVVKSCMSSAESSDCQQILSDYCGSTDGSEDSWCRGWCEGHPNAVGCNQRPTETSCQYKCASAQDVELLKQQCSSLTFENGKCYGADEQCVRCGSEIAPKPTECFDACVLDWNTRCAQPICDVVINRCGVPTNDLVKNGKFDSWDGGMPSNWQAGLKHESPDEEASRVPGSLKAITRSGNGVELGQREERGTTNYGYGMIKQDIPVQAGNTYTLTFQAVSTNPYGSLGARAYVWWIDANGNLLSSKPGVIIVMQESSDFREYCGVTEAAPQGAAYARIHFGIYSWGWVTINSVNFGGESQTVTPISGCAQPLTNLLSNKDFSSWDGGMPSNWQAGLKHESPDEEASRVPGSLKAITRSGNGVELGQREERGTTNYGYGMIKQDVPVRTGSTYSFVFKAISTNPYGALGARAYVWWLDANGNLLSSKPGVIIVMKDSDVFQEYCGLTDAAPQGAAYARIHFGIYSWGWVTVSYASFGEATSLPVEPVSPTSSGGGGGISVSGYAVAPFAAQTTASAISAYTTRAPTISPSVTSPTQAAMTQNCRQRTDNEMQACMDEGRISCQKKCGEVVPPKPVETFDCNKCVQNCPDLIKPTYDSCDECVRSCEKSCTSTAVCTTNKVTGLTECKGTSVDESSSCIEGCKRQCDSICNPIEKPTNTCPTEKGYQCMDTERGKSSNCYSTSADCPSGQACFSCPTQQETKPCPTELNCLTSDVALKKECSMVESYDCPQIAATSGTTSTTATNTAPYWPTYYCYKCPQETTTEACIALWDPVCGNDGRTYSNDCYAKTANVGVAYTGECKAQETTKVCPYSCLTQPRDGCKFVEGYDCSSVTNTADTKCYVC